ncbi:MAG: NAD(P)/FAD-dependent oxidoreductase [bacterium]
MYDVIIVGSGPAGIFAAREIALNSGMKVLMLDKGNALEKRRCPIRLYKQNCVECPECALLCGWGGAGAFSDGKLNLTTLVGGYLNEYIKEEDLRDLISYVDRIYVSHGAPDKVFGQDEEKIKDFSVRAAKVDMKLLNYPIRHLGTENCYRVLQGLFEELSGRVRIKFNARVEEIIVENGRAAGVRLTDGREMKANNVIIAVGREGSKWLSKESNRLGLPQMINPVDIGVRVEVPAAATQMLTDVLFESKLIFRTKYFNDEVRTFCMCPHGEVVRENYNGLFTVNGHSFNEKRTKNTNFALLVKMTFTEPFSEPITYGQRIAELANLLGSGIILQRLGDLKKGRRSTPERIEKGAVEPTLLDTTPGDLALVLPYRFLKNILEMIETLDNLMPGVDSPDTLLYGVEVKFYSIRLELKSSFETKIRSLYTVGDGAGISRGLIQASTSGVVAARDIIGKLPAKLAREKLSRRDFAKKGRSRYLSFS